MADQTNAEVSDERLRDEQLQLLLKSLPTDTFAGFPRTWTMPVKLLRALLTELLNRRSVTSQASEGAGKVEWTYMPSYGAMDWQQLTEAVSEARVGDRHHPLPGLTNPTSHIGYTMVPEINFNSLNRIVTAFVNAASPSKRVERLETATHRHVKRGSEYVLIGYGEMQADNWQVSRDGIDQSIDMEKVAIYRSTKDGSLWVRPVAEFEDGRFQVIHSGGRP